MCTKYFDAEQRQADAAFTTHTIEMCVFIYLYMACAEAGA